MKANLALAGALLCVCVSLAAPAQAQSALEFAIAQGQSVRKDSLTTVCRAVSPRVTKCASLDRRFASRVLRSETAGGILAGVTPALAAKAREIVASCGSTVISGRRHTRVAGSRHWSLHASGRAVDLRGNPGCIYARLRGWPGGYSTDYARVRHVHVSLGGREDGVRFAHGGRRHRHHRYAAR